MNTVADGKTESQQMSIAQVFTRYGTVGQLGRRDRWEYLLCQSKYYCSKKQLPWTPPTCVSLKTRSTGIVPAGTAGHWVRSASSPHESDGTVRLSCMSYAIKFNTMQRYRHNSMRTTRDLLAHGQVHWPCLVNQRTCPSDPFDTIRLNNMIDDSESCNLRILCNTKHIVVLEQLLGGDYFELFAYNLKTTNLRSSDKAQP